MSIALSTMVRGVSASSRSLAKNASGAAPALAHTYYTCAASSAARSGGLLNDRASAAALPNASTSSSSSLSQPRRGMGIMDRLNNMIEGRKKDTMAKKRAEVFQWQLEQLSGLASFSMGAHKKMLEESAEKMGLNDWRSMLRTKTQQSEIEEAWLDLKISQQLTPEELADPGLIHRREKMRIAGATGTEVSKVTAFLANYEQVKGMHRWIKSRKERGLPVPASLEDFQAAMVTDRAGITKEMQQPSRQKPRSTRGMLLKQFR